MDIFLDYQKRWIADKSQVKVCEKSRRVGLTWAEAADNVLTASATDGMDIWYIGYNKDMTKEYIDTCAEWAKHFNIMANEIEDINIVDEDKDILAYQIKFLSGYKIVALSSRPSNLRGKQGKVIIDEAAFHDDLSGLLKSALAFLIWGGKVLIISTHLGDDNPFNILVNDIRSGKLPYSLHRVTFDDAIADGLYERIAEVTKSRNGSIVDKNDWINGIYKLYGDDANEELNCVPANSGRAYLIASVIENCMDDKIKVLRFTPPSDDFVDWSQIRFQSYLAAYLEAEIKPLLDILPTDRRHFIGGDAARSGDLSAYWLLTERLDLVLDTAIVIELRDAPFRFQEAVIDYICNGVPNFSGAAFDARGNGQQMAETARIKFGQNRVLEVMSSDKFYLQAFPKLKSRIEDKTVTIPKDADILSDLRQVRVIKGIPKLSDVRTKDNKGNRHGDTAIALAMAIYAYNELGKYENWSYTSATTNEVKSLLNGY